MIIRLLDSCGLRIIDSVSTEYEDSFSLDTFHDTIAQHLATDPPTAFILARVQTWDPKQPDKAFYSYYNSYNLNKILFQTQVYLEKRLIHRLHVLNPLTNTDIIGHVQYFRVLPRNNATVTIEEDQITELPSRKPSNVSPVSFKESRKPKNGLKIKTNLFKSNDAPVSAGVREIDSGMIASWTLSAPAAAMIQDDMIHNVPSTPIYSNQRRLTLLVPKGELLPLRSAPLERTSFASRPLSPTYMDPLSLMNLSRINPTITLGFSEKNKTTVPVGQVTRFGVAIGSEELKNAMVYSTRTRKRMYSLANVLSVAGGCENYDQWLKQVRKSKGNDTTDYDSTASPLKTLPAESEADLGYDAVLFATDTDYLELSKIRAVFRINAVTIEEAALFEMKAYTGHDADSPAFRLLIEDQYQCEFCYPTGESLSLMPAWKQRWHRTKCLWIAALILAALIGAIVIIMVKTNQATVVAST